jgi:hypothetical protein
MKDTHSGQRMLDSTQEDNSQETAVQASPAGDGILVAKQKCHPDRSVPGFPATQHWTRPRVRPSVKKGA